MEDKNRERRGRNLRQNRSLGRERSLAFPGLSAAPHKGQEQSEHGSPSGGAANGGPRMSEASVRQTHSSMIFLTLASGQPGTDLCRPTGKKKTSFLQKQDLPY